MSRQHRIIVALDVPDRAQAKRLLREMGDVKPYIKVGMQLFYAAGPDFVRQLKAEGYAVFLDLKLHDIPQTVYSAAQSIGRLGVDMTTVHIAGGEEMLHAAVDGIRSVQGESDTRVVGITQLTSTDQHVLNNEIGIPGTVEQTVIRYTKRAKRVGLDGVVCSGWEAALIKREAGADFLAVTPGIRLSNQSHGDQKRVMTPEEAIQCGADYLVMGRPITKSENPGQTYARLCAIIEKMPQDV